MLADVGDEFIESGNPESMGIAAGIASVSSLEREIQLPPVLRPPYCA